MAHKTRILLVDDHQMMREGLRALLNAEPGVEIVGEAVDGRTAVRMTAELKPDVVIMDVNMPNVNGIEATRQVTAEGEQTKVIALSGHADHRFVTEMLRAGATGYVFKQGALEELSTALRTVVANQVYLSPSVAKAVTNYMRQGTSGGSSALGKLSAREREMLQLIAQGENSKQVAMHLRVSVKTVETYRRNIMDKLELDSVAELTKYAIREGLTSVDA